MLHPRLKRRIQNLRQGQTFVDVVEFIGVANQRRQAAVRLRRVRVSKLEQAPFRFLRDARPAGLLIKGLADGAEIYCFVFRLECFQAVFPPHERHRAQGQALIHQEGITTLTHIPVRTKRRQRLRRRRRPHLDSGVPTHDRLPGLERAHRLQINDDASAF